MMSTTGANRDFRTNSKPRSGFQFHVREQITCREEIRHQIATRIYRIRKIAHGIRRIKCSTEQIAPSSEMFGPRNDETGETQIYPGLKSLQPKPFDQIVAEPAEAKAGLVVAKARSRDHGKVYIGNTRPVAVAPLEAEIDRPARDQGMKVRTRKQSRW